MLTEPLFTIAKIWKKINCPLMNEWIKMWCMHVYRHTHKYMYVCMMYICAMEYYSAMKKEILCFATTRMDLKDMTLSEISQTQKDK